MRLGVVFADDTRRFFQDIYDGLASHYEVDIFKHRRTGLPFFQNRINLLLFRQALDNFLRTHDVVFFEWASELLAAASWMPKRCRIVTRLHRYEMFQWVSQINWAAVDRIILVSKAMQEKFVARWPMWADKTVVIPEAVSIERFEPAEKVFRGDIGTLCYLAPRKRVYELILAFSEAVRQRDDLHFHVGGSQVDGQADYVDAVQSLIRKLGLQDKVTFYGEVTDASNWYRNIDIFISNSYSEGLQVACIEAMASGCYTLSHRWDGAEELLPEANLFFTDNELKEKIIAYCEAPQTVKRQQQERMRAIACERCDIRQVETQVRNVIEEVAAGVYQ